MSDAGQIQHGSMEWYCSECSKLVDEAKGHGIQLVVAMREQNQLGVSGGGDVVLCLANCGAMDLQSFGMWMSEKARFDIWCGLNRQAHAIAEGQ